jgi:hypothetical protein
MKYLLCAKHMLGTMDMKDGCAEHITMRGKEKEWVGLSNQGIPKAPGNGRKNNLRRCLLWNNYSK